MSVDGRNRDFESPLEQRNVQWTVAAIALAVLTLVIIGWQAKLHWSHPDAGLRDELAEMASGQTAVVQIDINRARSHELALLPGVGPVLAERIVDDRDRNGEFISIADLRRVFGIGPKKIDEISRLCVVGNDAAKREESHRK